MRLVVFNGPSPKPPYRRKNLANISYTDRVIALFVPNFAAMATGVDREKCDWQHSMAHRKTPYRRKNLAYIFYTKRVIANFVAKFVAMATGAIGGKCNWQHSISHSRNPPINAKISQISLTQGEL